MIEFAPFLSFFCDLDIGQAKRAFERIIIDTDRDKRVVEEIIVENGHSMRHVVLSSGNDHYAWKLQFKGSMTAVQSLSDNLIPVAEGFPLYLYDAS
jgi:hypothetical protein